MSRSSRPRGARLLVLAAAALTLGGTALGAAPLATAAATTPRPAATVTGGGFVPVTTSRVIDTRSGLGVAARGKVGPGASLTSTLAGRVAGLPAGAATAVVLNLTSVGSTSGTYLTAYAAGTTVPGISSLNVPGGVTTANLVVVPISSDGRISVYNRAGSTDVVADIVGYYAAAENASYGGLEALVPKRFYDSRDGDGAFVSGDYVDLPFSFTDPADNASVTGFVADVTAVSPTSDGYFTAWDGSGAKPGTSSVSFHKGTTVSNLVEVRRGDHTDPSGTYPSFRVGATLFGGTADMVVDIVGVYLTPGAGEDARFVALPTPQRVVDTRTTQAPNLAPASTRALSAASIVTPSTIALAGNLTVAGASAPTYVTAFTGTQPPVSNISAGKGAVVANAAVIRLTDATSPGVFDAYNSAGTTPLLVDVVGTFETTTATTSASPDRADRADDALVARPAVRG